LSAQGDPSASLCSDEIYDTPQLVTNRRTREPWEIAKDYVSANLGLTPAMTGLAGLMCVSGMNIANNIRTISVNKTEGSVNATETFIAYTGEYAVTEEIEINTERSTEDPHTQVTVNGTIQGLSTIDYSAGVYEGCPPVGDLKFTNALTSWNGGISGSLYARANGVYKSSLPDNRPIGVKDSLNLIPLSESVGYNPIGGTVVYANTYNDRPDNINPFALREEVNWTVNYANDVFATLTVLGRTNGPLFQSIGTVGPTVAEISIDAVMAPANANVSGLSDAQWAPYNDLVTDYEKSLLNLVSVNQIFTNSYSETWQPQAGHYTLSKAWTLSKCE